MQSNTWMMLPNLQIWYGNLIILTFKKLLFCGGIIIDTDYEDQQHYIVIKLKHTCACTHCNQSLKYVYTLQT